MKEKKDQEPKIHVDADWKAQAQADKEKLAQQQGSGAKAQRPPLPPPDFSLLVLSLATQARLAFGDMENPATGRKQKDMDRAKHNINMLEMLEEKTKGNLNDAEKQLLDTALYELRMRYVQLA